MANLHRVSRVSHFFFCLVLLVSMVVGCGDSKKKKAIQKQSKKAYFIHGDPNQLIRSSGVRLLRFPSAVKRNLSGSHMALAHAFLTQSEDDSKPDAGVSVVKSQLTQWALEELQTSPFENSFYQLEDSNQTQFKPELNNLRNYVFEKVDSKNKRLGGLSGLLLYTPDDLKSGDLVFVFKAVEDFLKLEKVLIFDKQGNYLHVPIIPLHLSYQVEKSAISLLFEEASSGNLFHFVFTYNKASIGSLRYAELNQAFTYLFGEGVATKWEQAPTLNLCLEDESDSEWERVEIAAKLWRETLPTMQIKFKKEFPPFSDLHTSCIYLSKNYILSEKNIGGRIAGTLGVTIPSVDFVENRILAAPVFLFLPTIKKLSRNYLDQVEATALHEIGHFLGLGHEFRKTIDGKPLFRSIMSYDPSVSILTNHDKAAVAMLYGSRDVDRSE